MNSRNSVLDEGMQNQTKMQTYRERELNHQIAKLLETWGNYESVQRLVRKYGKLNTLRGYLVDLDLYFRWLPSVGVTLNPDELITDNLVCFSHSDPTDVRTKRKHTDLMDRYTNVFLVKNGVGFSSRHHRTAAIRQFYKRNDSPLFGDFSLADGKPEEGTKTPSAQDIREVLRALPIQQRVPMVLMWQAGMEPDIALSLTWGKINLEGDYIKLDFLGRKRHKKPYFKIAGHESVTNLKIWRQRWREDMGRDPGPDDLLFYGKRHGPMAAGWLNKCLKRTAIRMHKEGLIANGDPDSWHVYALRHSFSTECAHAEVKPEVREYWMGHVTAIYWVYQHPELHEQDFIGEYAKVEPYLSLNPSEVVVKARVSAEFEARLERLETQILEYTSKRG